MTDEQTTLFCRCGCGTPTTATWAPGHDATYLEEMTKKALGDQATRLSLIEHLEGISWNSDGGIPHLESPTGILELFDTSRAQSQRIANVEECLEATQSIAVAGKARLERHDGRINGLEARIAEIEGFAQASRMLGDSLAASIREGSGAQTTTLRRLEAMNVDVTSIAETLKGLATVVGRIEKAHDESIESLELRIGELERVNNLI